MRLRDLQFRLWSRRAGRLPVDDAYLEWISAHARCADVLRAWRAAAPERRAIAYRVYRACVEREEAAATWLRRCQGRLSAS